LRRLYVGARLRGVQQLFVLFHSPGAAWDRGLGFMQQPGIEQHIAFLRSLTERGLMVASGLIRVTTRPWTVPMGFAREAFPASDEG
jgi:hypothetical protein